MKLDDELVTVLREAGLIGKDETADRVSLEGGVSSDVICAVTSHGRYCIKRALPRLKVAKDWSAPVERALNEASYLDLVNGFCPGVVPKVLYVDRKRFLFIMDYLPPDSYPGWKALLASGRTDARFAEHLGATLGQIHVASAKQAESLSTRFANHELFHALRIEPYLLTAAAAHSDVADEILCIIRSLEAHSCALIHGDVSPKNILVGPNGPVVLDAECATWGDPAFDLAFCSTHLLLKAVWHREFVRGYEAAFDGFCLGYFSHTGGDERGALEARAVCLVAALLLARIDGKSPVEYIVAEVEKEQVRAAARSYLLAPPTSLKAMAANWYERALRA
jgi:5-methylthioribose kinase